MGTTDTKDRRVKALLAEAGTTYADEAGIRLADTPAPLWQLLVLSNLTATRIKASIAVHAARELFDAGGGTPERMADLTWQQRVDALGRAHYVRYDEGTATRLGECADLVRARYGGDLRHLARDADMHRDRVEELLQAFPGIGPAGARIFCREAQGIWPFLRPVLDEKALDGAGRVGLPKSPAALAELVGGDDLARFAAALVRVDLDKELADRVKAAP
ncbi:endonuclease [Embleya sp. NBC_00896]|uniref:endonuclease n=1 Tax=Embleya sp. NBC_00896 TaxID=2975961 RepID=UPI002F913781|nr:endonuclease [Embleya sp. NBC_00896]